MPRRLGDDPLTRARDERAKAAQATAPVASDSGVQGGVAYVAMQSASHTSSNDVFFQRRADGSNVVLANMPQEPSAEVRAAPEAPEISEISEIPEIREVSTASNTAAGADMAASVEVKASSEGGQDKVAQPALPVSIVEEVVANLNGGAAQEAATEVKREPASLSPASHAINDSMDEPEPEPQKGSGFFKRLFGKFK